MEQVADSMDPLGSQNLGDARPHAFDVLNRCGKFEHALIRWEDPPLDAARRKLQQEW